MPNTKQGRSATYVQRFRPGTLKSPTTRIVIQINGIIDQSDGGCAPPRRSVCATSSGIESSFVCTVAIPLSQGPNAARVPCRRLSLILTACHAYLLIDLTIKVDKHVDMLARDSLMPAARESMSILWIDMAPGTKINRFNLILFGA